jgi:hypothetical protein
VREDVARHFLRDQNSPTFIVVPALHNPLDHASRDYPARGSAPLGDPSAAPAGRSPIASRGGDGEVPQPSAANVASGSSASPRTKTQAVACPRRPGWRCSGRPGWRVHVTASRLRKPRRLVAPSPPRPTPAKGTLQLTVWVGRVLGQKLCPRFS